MESERGYTINSATELLQTTYVLVKALNSLYAVMADIEFLEAFELF